MGEKKNLTNKEKKKREERGIEGKPAHGEILLALLSLAGAHFGAREVLGRKISLCRLSGKLPAAGDGHRLAQRGWHMKLVN